MKTALEVILSIIGKLSSFMGKLYWHKKIFRWTGLFVTKKFPEAKKQHKYGILISARNEEAVIGKLLESIRNQDYPAELITTFVIAHNCTDNTAEVVRRAGGNTVCYEWNDDTKRTKGFALQYLIEQIRKDYGIESFDGYLIFDADNLLKEDYMTRMNESFDSGETVVTSYRNTKNFDDNWISASYGIHWLRTIRLENRAKSLFRLPNRVQGTGYMFPSKLVRDGWKYTGLTEDRYFCGDIVTEGYNISYNNRAEFYDEQPTDIKVAMRQRLRWSKGHIEALCGTGPKLLSNIFVTRGAANRNEPNAPWYKKLWRNIWFRVRNLEMLTIVFPRNITLSFKKISTVIIKILLAAMFAYECGLNSLPGEMRDIVQLFDVTSVPQKGVWQTVGLICLFTFAYTVNTYIENIVRAAYVLIAERKRIKKMKWYKKVWYCITFPIFDLIGKLTILMALFMKVDWKPIPHKVAVGLDKVK
ncbi:MAG: glycosyltransferase family 2 protein [Clostridia bacterium]|nr:glycosyltransferase family 2 protein [Clostridia bacterium]